MVCTPVIVFGLLALADAAAPHHVVLFGASAALLLYWLALDVRAALLAAPLLGLLTYLAAALGAYASHPVSVAIAVVVGGGIAQAGTHMFEPVPPPLSGTDGFVDGRTYLRKTGLGGMVRGALLWLGCYWILEVWAAPRVLVLQAQELLLAFGCRPAFAANVRREVARFVRSPAAWIAGLRSTRRYASVKALLRRP
jgi:hypothetical protein